MGTTNYSKNYHYQLNDAQFKVLKDSFCLEDDNIRDFYEYYRLFDRYDRSYIDFDDFLDYFKRDISDFVELPYAERLYKCIPKQKQSIVFFQDFVKGISTFCLFSKQSLLRFIFDYIDTDGDEKINKRDIIKLAKYANPQNKEYVFFTSFIPDIQRFPLKQNQIKIDFDHFRLNYDKLLFLIWPAFSLQQFIRKNILGVEFWNDLYGKVEKKQIQYKNNEKKEQRMKQKIQTLKRLKHKSIYYQINTIKPTINQRKWKQTADDCKILVRSKVIRRKSMLYKKSELLFQNSQLEQNQQ